MYLYHTQLDPCTSRIHTFDIVWIQTRLVEYTLLVLSSFVSSYTHLVGYPTVWSGFPPWRPSTKCPYVPMDIELHRCNYSLIAMLLFVQPQSVVACECKCVFIVNSVVRWLFLWYWGLVDQCSIAVQEQYFVLLRMFAIDVFSDGWRN